MIHRGFFPDTAGFPTFFFFLKKFIKIPRSEREIVYMDLKLCGLMDSMLHSANTDEKCGKYNYF